MVARSHNSRWAATLRQRIAGRVGGGGWRSWWADSTAGVTVAMVGIPQGLAYATIVGVDPLFGLYAAIIPTIVAALIRISPYLVTGPTNATALATASVLAAFSGRHDYAELVFALAVMSGILQLTFGALRLGSLMRYVSNSVLTGFLAGVGTLIIIAQLPPLLALPRAPGSVPAEVVLFLLGRVHEANGYVLTTGVLTILIILAGKRIAPKIPGALAAVALVGLFVLLAAWQQQGVVLVGEVVPSQAFRLGFHVPDVSAADLSSIFPGAGALALLSLVESLSIGKAVGALSHRRLDSSRELIAQGIGCFVGGFARCIPSSSSPSRTAIVYEHGARTRLAGGFSGIVALIVLVTAPRLIRYIPMAALAGVVVASAGGLIDWHHIRLTWRTRGISRLVMATTFITTLIFPMHYAIYLGLLLSILIFLYESGVPHMSYLTLNGGGEFVEKDFEAILAEEPSIAVVDVEGPLHFAAVERLEDQLERILHKRTRVLILRLRDTHLLASTAVAALEDIIGHAKEEGVTILLSGASEQARDILKSSGLEAVIGGERIFGAQPVLFESTRDALAYAHRALEEKGRTAVG